MNWGNYISTEYELEPGARLVMRSERLYLEMVENVKVLADVFADIVRQMEDAVRRACEVLASIKWTAPVAEQLDRDILGEQEA